MPIHTTDITLTLPLAGPVHISVTYEREAGYPDSWYEPGVDDYFAFISASLGNLPLYGLPSRWRQRLLDLAVAEEDRKARDWEPMSGWDAPDYY